MIFELPQPRHERLPAAPLELVVWQLQFTEAAAVVSPSVGTGIAEALSADGGGGFQMLPLSALTLALGPGQPQGVGSSPEADGWQLRRGQLVVNVGRSAVAVETTAYDGWTSFRATIAALCGSLGELISVPGEQRLGLRYVDRIALPGVMRPGDWKDLLAPWLAAPLAHDKLGDAVLAVSGQVELTAGESTRATIRHRAFPDFERRGRHTVMLDLDTFRLGYRPFDANAVVTMSDEFNDIAHRLFEASITPALYDVFAREEDGPV